MATSPPGKGGRFGNPPKPKKARREEEMHRLVGSKPMHERFGLYQPRKKKR